MNDYTLIVIDQSQGEVHTYRIQSESLARAERLAEAKMAKEHVEFYRTDDPNWHLMDGDYTTVPHTEIN